jgi:hypothetical protein
MSPREARELRNEALFREVNAHIAELEERVGMESTEVLPLLCECARSRCTFPIEVDAKTFDRVRENPLWFLVAPGHEQLEVEAVVEQRPGYFIVEKHMT